VPPLTWEPNIHIGRRRLLAIRPDGERNAFVAPNAAFVSQGSLAGTCAIVTGANRGIGLAIATAFAVEGASCVMVVRDLAAGEKAAASIKDVAVRPVVREADVSDRGEVASLAMEVGEQFDAVDVLVNNAGILLDSDRKNPASTMDPEDLEETLNVNLWGAVNMCEAFIPQMRRGARIINVSSTMGQLSDGSAGYAPAYCISKTALNAWTQALAEDLKSKGIMVDCFHPGWAKTRMGGPGAGVDPNDSAKIALMLATRAPSDRTGLFWDHTGVIPW
jgi:NAD(P)-dependent dehydrogenase (short-subunit alcohol dehydrogenase family)